MTPLRPGPLTPAISADVLGRSPEETPAVVMYHRVGNVGVYWLSRRERARLRFLRHCDRHAHPSGFGYCDEALRLFYDQHPADTVLIG